MPHRSPGIPQTLRAAFTTLAGSEVELRVHEMLHDGFILHMPTNLSFDFTIAASGAFMPANLFSPRRDQKRLKIHVGVFEITKNPPP